MAAYIPTFIPETSFSSSYMAGPEVMRNMPSMFSLKELTCSQSSTDGQVITYLKHSVKECTDCLGCRGAKASAWGGEREIRRDFLELMMPGLCCLRLTR